MTGNKLCTAIRRDGQPCQARPIESGLCFAHADSLRQRTQEGRKRGGHNRSKVARAQKYVPPDLTAVRQLLEAALVQVFQGTLPASRGTALASIAGAICRLHDTGQLQMRLDELESRLESEAQVRAGRR